MKGAIEEEHAQGLVAKDTRRTCYERTLHYLGKRSWDPKRLTIDEMVERLVKEEKDCTTRRHPTGNFADVRTGMARDWTLLRTCMRRGYLQTCAREGRRPSQKVLDRTPRLLMMDDIWKATCVLVWIDPATLEALRLPYLVPRGPPTALHPRGCWLTPDGDMGERREAEQKRAVFAHSRDMALFNDGVRTWMRDASAVATEDHDNRKAAATGARVAAMWNRFASDMDAARRAEASVPALVSPERSERSRARQAALDAVSAATLVTRDMTGMDHREGRKHLAGRATDQLRKGSAASMEEMTAAEGRAAKRLLLVRVTELEQKRLQRTQGQAAKLWQLLKQSTAMLGTDAVLHAPLSAACADARAIHADLGERLAGYSVTLSDEENSPLSLLNQARRDARREARRVDSGQAVLSAVGGVLAADDALKVTTAAGVTASVAALRPVPTEHNAVVQRECVAITDEDALREAGVAWETVDQDARARIDKHVDVFYKLLHTSARAFDHKARAGAHTVDYVPPVVVAERVDLPRELPLNNGAGVVGPQTHTAIARHVELSLREAAGAPHVDDLCTRLECAMALLRTRPPTFEETIKILANVTHLRVMCK